MHIIFLAIIISILAFFVYASANIRSGVYLHVFCRKKTKEKIIALTFDDGPDQIQTPKVLDVLRERQIPACFFCIGNKIKGNEKLLRQIIDEGHCIGNHSFSHSVCFPLYGYRRMQRDLTACQQELERVTGMPVQWFRPPFGVTNPTLAQTIHRLEYTTIGWNIRTLDTLQPASEKIIRRIKKRLAPGSILLLHDHIANSDQLLIQILNLLAKEGYTVVSLDTLLQETPAG
ncbi:polysaccharide deacetylase family protein [Phocaeicola sp.]|uniref:polysaccharide deacetylase family protein n=1 Tax=Phocaeicola sp. TaxID=2773926 RepID=UPI0023C42AF5|nr:polysaccharide deacetylase family protein [Phocaeicola sp.]MDE5678501.1 polysaccharide deacetylase family protein [Phocaeicola sp.]